jgi:hypothetical protein
MKRIRPRTAHESRMQMRFRFPHDTWMNHDEAVRIARRRWKKNRSRYLRRLNRVDCHEA